MEEKIPIVAIGASAGGLTTIFSFFKNVPEDIGVAFIIIRHLKRDYKSVQAELLQDHTKLKVNEIIQGQKIERNHVYMLPEGKKLEIHDQTLYLHDRPDNEIINTAIDDFFFSLAQDAGDKAIGIILSGLGSDGTKGAHFIEEFGGTIMVQDPNQAQFDGMPKSVIYFDHPDYVLKIQEMPYFIAEHFKDPVKARKTLLDRK